MDTSTCFEFTLSHKLGTFISSAGSHLGGDIAAAKLARAGRLLDALACCLPIAFLATRGQCESAMAEEKTF